MTVINSKQVHTILIIGINLNMTIKICCKPIWWLLKIYLLVMISIVFLYPFYHCKVCECNSCNKPGCQPKKHDCIFKFFLISHALNASPRR